MVPAIMSDVSNLRRRGVLLIMSSPSGAGKTTLSRRLLEFDPNITMSVSVTTRARRSAEISGRDYIFIDRPTFDKMVAGHELLEHADVFGNGYGSPRKPVEDAISQGRDMLFDIDWQGADQLRRSLSDDVVSIFILPPSIEELERRLRGRGQDAEEVVQRRMAAAKAEMSHWHKYDYVVINADVEKCLGEIQAILAAERLKLRRQIGLTEFTAALLA